MSNFQTIVCMYIYFLTAVADILVVLKNDITIKQTKKKTREIDTIVSIHI